MAGPNNRRNRTMTARTHALAEFIKAEAAKWSKVVKDANLKVE
jgi:hypothetical protein